MALTKKDSAQALHVVHDNDHQTHDSTETTIRAEIKSLEALVRDLRKQKRALDAEIKATGPKRSADDSAKLYRCETQLLRDIEEANERKRRLKSMLKREEGQAWKALFSDAILQQTGLTPDANRFGYDVRYADADKYVYVGRTRKHILDAAYLGQQIIKRYAGDDVRVTAMFAHTFDIDCEINPSDWQRLFPSLPYSYLVGRQMSDGTFIRPHAIIYLNHPVKLSNKFGKDRFDRVQNVIATRLLEAGFACDADAKVVAKNPFSNRWEVSSGNIQGYSLDEIEEALGITKNGENVISFVEARKKAESQKKITKPSLKLVDQTVGRNHTLFETLRHVAYGYCKRKRSYMDIASYIEGHAIEINAEFPRPLRRGVLDSTIKSIAKFCANKVFKNRGAACDLIRDDMTKSQAQRAGARYTAEMKATKTFDLVQEAKTVLGEKATIKGVARELGISKTTVRSYWYKDDVKQTVAVQLATMTRQAKANKNVASIADHTTKKIAAKRLVGGQLGVVREVVSDDMDAPRDNFHTYHKVCDDSMEAYAEALDAEIGSQSACKHTRYLYAHYRRIALETGDITEGCETLPSIYVDAIIADLHEYGLRSS